MKDLNGKIVFITGGSSGYGKATARALSQAGAYVIIAARNEDGLKAAKEETGSKDYFVMDVTNYSDWEKGTEG